MRKRLTAMLLVVCMLFTFMPTAFAETPDVTVDKTATRTGANTWDITMTIENSVELYKEPLELILVIDSSGSMAWCTKEAHTHTDACYDCGLTTHKHQLPSSGMFGSMQGNCYAPACGNENWWHTHNENCYFNCSGGWGHQHTTDCLRNPKPICGQEEHTHTDCMLVCEQEEHEHNQSTHCGVEDDEYRMPIAKDAADALVAGLAAEGVSMQVGVVDFDSSATSSGWITVTAEDVEDGRLKTDSAVRKSIYKMEAEGGTAIDKGLNAAINLLKDKTDSQAQKVVVLIGDGDNNNGSDTNAKEYAKTIKTTYGAKLYTIAFASDIELLETIGDEYFTTGVGDNAAAALQAIMNTITRKIAAMVTDSTSGSNVSIQGGISVTSDTEGEVTKIDGKNFKWNPTGDSLEAGTTTITYTVKLDETAQQLGVGEHNVALNGDAKLTYQIGGESGNKSFPVPKDTVTVGSLAESYVLLDENGNQVYSSTPETTYKFAWNDATFDWDADNTKTRNGVTYYYEGTVCDDDDAAQSGRIPVDSAAHTVVHTYSTKRWELSVAKMLTEVKRSGTALSPIPNKVKVGDVLTWTITVKNTGNQDLTGITLADVLKSGENTVASDKYSITPDILSSFDLSAGAKREFTATYTVQSEDAGKILSNTAAAEGSNGTSDSEESRVTVENTYNVTYDLNGGSWNGATDPSQTGVIVGTDMTVTTIVPQKAGFDFKGWTITGISGMPSATGGESFSMPENHVTLTAKWEGIPSYTVTYNWTGDIPTGKTVPASDTVQRGGSHTVDTTYYEGMTVNGSKDGVPGAYTFSGWDQSGSITVNAVITINGKWEFTPKTYTVTVRYVTDTGVKLFDETEVESVAYNSDYSVTVSGTGDPTHTDLAFAAPKCVAKTDTVNGVTTTYAYDSIATTDALTGKVTADVVVRIVYSLDQWKDDPDGPDSETGGDGTPDKYQAKIVYQPDAASKGSVTPTLDIVTLKNGAAYTTSAQVTAASTASAAASYKFTSWTSDISGLDLTAQGKTLSQPFTAAGNGAYTFTANFELDVAPLTVNYITDGDPAQTLKTADSKNVTIGNGYKIAEPGDTTGTPDYTIVEKLTDETGHKFAYDPIATGVSNLSGTMTASGKTVNVIYSADNNDDGIPDKYQATVTFKVVNGAWNDKTTVNVVRTVTLTDAAGKWAADGTYTLTASDIPAAGSEPNTGYKAGDWEAPKPEAGTTKITQAAEFTYKYVIIPCSYRIDLHYVARDGSDTEVEGTVTSADYGTAITALLPSGYTSAQTYGGESYLYDTYTVSGNATTLTDAQNPTVIDIYYDIDAIGTRNPDEGDNVPDKDQLIFTFVSADTNTGEVSGAVKQVVTKDTDGKANPASVATATAKTNYAFAYWSTGDKKDYTIGMTDLKDDGYAVDTTFTATFLADNKGGGTEGETPDGTPDAYQIFIKYVSKDTKAGTVSPTFETINLTRDSNQELIVKNVALRSGSLAVVTDANVYSFDRWELAGEKVGSNAALTYTFDEVVPASTYTFYAFFAKEASEMELNAAYKVEHYKENADGTYTLAENDFPLYDKIGATVKAVAKDYDGYTVDLQAEGTVASGEVIKPELNPDGTGVKILVLKLYYAVDNWNENNNQETGGDDIPDKYQVLVKYTSERGGEITGLEKEVITLKDANGKYLTQGDVEASGSEVERTSSKYRFDEWTGDWTNKSLGDDEELEPFTIKDAEGGKIYIVTAEFNKKSSSETIKEPEVPQGLNGDDHFQYIFGYDDGTVRPLAKITRAEVAAIFYRLLDDETREYYFTTENDFPDMKDTMWYNKAVSTLANAGIITGCSDGLFHGGRNITRAELATIIAKFDNITYRGEDLFSDISGHWARAYINSSADKGWIVGDGTGKFRPYDDITRAEVMTMINAVLNRAVDEDGLCDGYKKWPDNTKGTWYYYQVIEATNYHDYEREADMTETWLEILPDKIWDEAGR